MVKIKINHFIRGAISASILIAIASYCYLSLNNIIVGAILFAFGLYVICTKHLILFTGQAGYIVAKPAPIGYFALITIVNILITYGLGWIASLNPAVCAVAMGISATKLAHSLLWTFISAICCGIIMYITVSIFREQCSPIGIFFGVPIFILCGFDHTVANAFYLGAAQVFSPYMLLFILICTAGNILGSKLIRWLMRENTKD